MSCALCPCKGCVAERARRRECERQLKNLEKLLPYMLEVPLVVSAMIRLLDDPAWRESLKVAETPLTTSGTFTLFTDGTGRYFDYAGNEVKLSRT